MLHSHSHENFNVSNYASTADITLILDEREKRLQTKEELVRCKEQILTLSQQNERLLKEVSKEKRSEYASTQLGEVTDRNEKLQRQSSRLQDLLDQVKDENISLKLRVADLESEILQERKETLQRFELSIETIKAEMHEKTLSQKIRFDEELLKLKEQNFKLTIEVQGYQERNQILKEQLILFRERITELERETLKQQKENYVLTCELDYEAVKAKELQAKNDNLLAGVNVNKHAELKEREQLIQEYERRTHEIE